MWPKLILLTITAGTANMIPPLMAKVWPKWKSPVDGGKTFKEVRILGDHKTWRGLVTGIIGAEIIFLVMTKLVILDLPWWFGGILGFGVLGGDMIKSFFKRQCRVPAGKSWFPWDQIDWVLGLIVIAMGWKLLNIEEILILLTIGLLLHLLVKVIGFWLRVNETVI